MADAALQLHGRAMSDNEIPESPSATWRASSGLTTGLIGSISRSFLLGFSRLETNGLDGFLRLLGERSDPNERQRGLITVSNHLSVLDDPLMWGSIPYSWHWNPNNVRWALGSHDIVFRNKAFTTFFNLGQTLPTHRLAHSHHGGLFQATMTQAIRLLSSRPFQAPQRDYTPPIGPDPFSSNHLTYTTDGEDTVPSPCAYISRRHSWIHIYPEGRTHQKPDKTMRYFKWGVARLILEAEPMPDLVPIWIENFDQIMHESRQTPRFLPRPGKDVSITFGERVDMQAQFGDLKARWLALRDAELAGRSVEMGILPERLQHGKEAVRLREECTMRVREEVLKLRRRRGWPDEDPKARFVDTWRVEGGNTSHVEGKLKDGSWVKDV